jgi:hypothetical protein
MSVRIVDCANSSALFAKKGALVYILEKATGHLQVTISIFSHI